MLLAGLHLGTGEGYIARARADACQNIHNMSYIVCKQYCTQLISSTLSDLHLVPLPYQLKRLDMSQGLTTS
jgi:hypothetical protein